MECQHGSCTCQVTAADPYCGDFCREQGAMSQLGCGCGHPECQGSAMSEDL